MSAREDVEATLGTRAFWSAARGLTQAVPALCPMSACTQRHTEQYGRGLHADSLHRLGTLRLERKIVPCPIENLLRSSTRAGRGAVASLLEEEKSGYSSRAQRKQKRSDAREN